MPWRGPEYKGEFPTLGYQVGDWIEANIIIPDGDRKGEPYLLTDEMWHHLLWSYRLDPNARPEMRSRAYRYYGGLLVRPQKWGKDPFAASMICAQALADVQFDGWDANGEPVGRPVATPVIQCVANSEEQTPVTFAPVYTMLTEGPLANEPGLDIGLTRINLPGGGEIKAVSSSARSRIGARLTFASFTEALAIDTPIPTPTGWATMGELQPGDQVYGADGSAVTVTQATGVQYDRKCYRVEFRDGTDLIASDGHLWLARVTGSGSTPRVMTTQQIVDDGRDYRIPTVRPIAGVEQELPIDPYILGLWLGDGDSRNATITIGHEDVDEIKRLIESRGYTYTQSEPGARGCRLYVSVPGSVRGRHSKVQGLKPRLRELDLIQNKHIPAQYLRASYPQRVQLLRGLMDSDGCAVKNGSCFFSQTNKTLVTQVEELLRSLGQLVSTRYTEDAHSTSGGYYRMNFTPRWGFTPFALPRKAARVVGCVRSESWTGIERITEVPSVPVRCIAVNAPDRLFVAGDGWHVTHNTHLFTESSGGVEVARAMKRNLAGMGGRWVEITNAWNPAEASVAQRTYESNAPGVFIDYRPPRTRVDLEDDAALHAELLYVYGDSAVERGGWVDVERVMAEARDKSTGEGQARRFFLNEVTVGSRDAIDVIKWAAQRKPEKLAPGERIALGFHGSQTRDATSLVAARISDGKLFHLRTWEKPGHVAEKQWAVPRDQVNQAVHDAFAGYDVVVLMATPATWQDEVNAWEGCYPKQILELWTNSDVRMDQLIERFMTAHRGGELTHDGDETLTAHATAAALAEGKRRPAAEERAPGQPDHYQRVVRKSWALSISAFIAALLAYEARGWAYEHGLAEGPDLGPPNLW